MIGGASSAKYILLSNILSKVVLLITGIFLARFLEVEDFGYLLTLNIIFGFINLFSISGYEFYFIQNHEHQKSNELILLRQVFNLRVLQSFLLFIITNIVAFSTFLYYDPVLGKLLFITSFLFLTSLISKPEETVLSKNLNYKIISISGFIRDLIGSIAKIIFALLGAGPLTFSLGNVVGNISFSGIIKAKHNLRLLKTTSFKDQIEKYAKIRKFGFHLFLNTAGGFFTKQVDKLFVASYFNKSDQGIYQFANNYAGYAFNALISPQNSMALSLMAKNKNNTSYLLTLFRHYGIISGMIIVPLVILIFIMASEIIPFVFGVKWADSITLFRVFLIYYFIKILLYPSNGILTSFGRPDIKAKITILSFLIALPLLGFVSYFNSDITLYALVFILISTVSDLICTVKGFNLMNASLLDFLKQRISTSLPFIVLIPALLWLQFINIEATYTILLGLLLTFIAIYIVINIRSNIFLESLSTFIKNKKVLNLFSKYILIK